MKKADAGDTSFLKKEVCDLISARSNHYSGMDSDLIISVF